jgi:uncharacterized lipoprotein YddW (UPF0748 family)
MTIRHAVLAAAFLAVGAFSAAAPASDGRTTAIPEVQREFRAAWVATVANIDWPSSRTLSTEQQKAELIAILDKAVELKLNAIVLQVRPACDALYDSKLEPWSPYLTGTMGKAPDPYYDPLEFAVEESHKRGLELHTWFNPYRALHPSYKGKIPDSHISKAKPGLAKKYGGHLWLDPGEKEVQKHSHEVMLDVVKRYDIDGVHMDDYFYPYKEKGKDGKILDFPDEDSWKKYKESGGELSRNDWRRDNVNQFVKHLYEGIKKEKPSVKLGISPFGIWKPGFPEQIKGFNQYEELYADAKLWLEKGWVDYWTPQLYWKIDKPDQSFPVLLKWWTEQNKMKRHVWPGQFTSRVNDKSKTSWSASEILYQIQWTRLTPGATGNVHFSMKAFLDNRDGLNDELTTPGGLYAQPALVPASPWLDDKAPAAPEAGYEVSDDGARMQVKWSAKDPADVRLWVVYAMQNGKWSIDILPAGTTEKTFTAATKSPLPTEVMVSAVDPTGNESKRTTAKTEKE